MLTRSYASTIQIIKFYGFKNYEKSYKFVEKKKFHDIDEWAILLAKIQKLHISKDLSP